MRTHYIEHVPFESLGSIEPWLFGVGSTLICTRFCEFAALPGMVEFDLLIIMGGPMSRFTSL